MESQRFDDISRMMGSGASRRTVLRGVVGGALAAVGLGGAVAAQAEKFDICHLTGNGSYRHISVNANALDTHLAHGDRIPDICDENFEIDPATCECSCPITDCGLGRTIHPGRCACWCGPTGAHGDSCGEGASGACLVASDGDLVCVDTSSSCGEPCESSEDCPNGQVCARNESGCGDAGYRCLVTSDFR